MLWNKHYVDKYKWVKIKFVQYLNNCMYDVGVRYIDPSINKFFRKHTPLEPNNYFEVVSF